MKKIKKIKKNNKKLKKKKTNVSSPVVKSTYKHNVFKSNEEKNYSIEDQQRLITMIQKIQRLSKEASDTLNNLENPFTELLD